MDFETIIGLEVHVQLNTNTKLFCGCKTSFGEAPNANVCPVCMALPGALPVINKEAVKKSIMLGKALCSKINTTSIFNRKSYFYPDLPSGYQTTQFDVAIVEGGALEIEYENPQKEIVKKTINITRAHLENDAGKNTHGEQYSCVDLNRAGTPLIEIVSEPDMRNANEVVAYLKKLHSIVRFLKISDANMNEGSFRCDVNISIRPKGDNKLYTRSEIKNMNSFKFIASAIEYEQKRHINAWENGTYEQEIVQETRLFNTSTFKTASMRGKEDSADYRYFPDPDLPPLRISEEFIAQNSDIPPLADEIALKMIEEYGLSKYDSEILTSSPAVSEYFMQMIDAGVKPKLANSWISVELFGRLSDGELIENSKVNAKKLSELTLCIQNGDVSAKAGKEVLDYLFEHEDCEVNEAIDKLGLKQINDDSLIIKMIEEVIANNQDKVAEYKAGKDKLLGFFVGQVLKASKGSANPQMVNKMMSEYLNK